MKKILLALSLVSCIDSQGMNISQILDRREQELEANIFEVRYSEDESPVFAQVISMKHLLQLIMKIPKSEFFYSVMVDHIIPSPVARESVYKGIADILPPLSIIDSEGFQWKVSVPSVEISWLAWGTMFMDAYHEEYHLPFLKVMINDFLKNDAGNRFLGLDVKLQNVVNICKHEPALHSMKKRAVQYNNLEQFERILNRIDPRRIQVALDEQNKTEKRTNSKIRIKKSEAIEVLQDLYSVMRLDQVETENIEGFYIPNEVRNWSKAERVTRWMNWMDYIKQRADIRDLLNNKEANPDEVAQKYYIPMLQAFNIEINWAKHYELMPLLMDVINEYCEFVDYKHKPYPFLHNGVYDTRAPAYVALSDYISVLSEDLVLRLSDVNFPEVTKGLVGIGISVQSSTDAWGSWLEKFSQYVKPKTLNSYYLPFMKFFSSKMVKGDMFFGGGHTKFITILQDIISDGIKNCQLDTLGRGYRYTDCRLLTLPAIIWDCCKKAELIISGATSNSNVYDVLMFLDKTLEISSKDMYLLGYNGDDLLKLCNQQDLQTIRREIKKLLWDSANPNYPRHKTHQTIKDKLIPKIRQKLDETQPTRLLS